MADKKRPLSDTDAAALDELLEEREFQAKLEQHNEKQRAARQKRIESARAWITLLASVGAAATLLKDWWVAVWKLLAD